MEERRKKEEMERKLRHVEAEIAVTGTRNENTI